MWHFRSACDIITRQRVWVNVDNTWTGTAAQLAAMGRCAT